jgi:nicotinamidase/pyrazinamidase
MNTFNNSPKKGFPCVTRDGKKNFVVVIDVQYDFMKSNGALYVPDAEITGRKIDKFLSSLSPEDCAGVLFTFDTHHLDDYHNTEEAQQFPPHCVFSTPGWALDCDYKSISKEIPLYMLQKEYFDMWKEDVNIYPYPKPRSNFGTKESEFFFIIKR